jgi:hypothetical protein
VKRLGILSPHVLCLALCITSLAVWPVSGEPLPFGPGEQLTFAVKYGVITAGTAIMQVRDTVTCDGGKCFHIVSEARTTKPFSFFFEVSDRVESLMDAEGLYTWRYEKNLSEGTYKAHEVVVFDQNLHTATYPDGKVIEIPERVQDVLTSLYYVRTLDLEVGKSVFIDNHSDEKNYTLEVKVLRTEKVKVPAGTYECFVVEPILRASGIFQHKGRLTVWLSTDRTRRPIMMKSKVIIGSINAVLTDVIEG